MYRISRLSQPAPAQRGWSTIDALGTWLLFLFGSVLAAVAAYELEIIREKAMKEKPTQI